MSNQTTAAASADQGRNEARSMLGRVVAWSLANQLNAKHAMDSATLQRMGVNLEQIPPSAFGNTNINIGGSSQPTGSSPLLKAAAVGLSALGLGAGGIGLYSLISGIASKAPALPISTPAPVPADDIPLIIDWTWQDGGNNPDAGSPTRDSDQ